MYNKELSHRVTVDIPKPFYKKIKELSKKLTREHMRRVSVNEVLRSVIIEEFK